MHSFDSMLGTPQDFQCSSSFWSQLEPLQSSKSHQCGQWPGARAHTLRADPSWPNCKTCTGIGKCTEGSTLWRKAASSSSHWGACVEWLGLSNPRNCPPWTGLAASCRSCFKIKPSLCHPKNNKKQQAKKHQCFEVPAYPAVDKQELCEACWKFPRNGTGDRCSHKQWLPGPSGCPRTGSMAWPENGLRN